jgi:hypothetical protein
MRDIQTYAKDRLAELMHDKVETVDDLRSEANDLEEDFDGDSFAPYYNQKQEVIDQYEREFGSDAEDICGEATFKASDYMAAMSAYADAIGWTAFSSYFAEAKEEFSDALDAIQEAIEARGLDADDVKVSVSSSDPFGWSAHNREDATGSLTLCIHESGQLDGINGISAEVWSGLHLSFTWDPSKPAANEAE